MGAGLCADDSGEQRAPTPLYCVVCLSAGLPEPLAMIGEDEPMYATENGEPVCSSCGFGYNLTAMERPHE